MNETYERDLHMSFTDSHVSVSQLCICTLNISKGLETARRDLYTKHIRPIKETYVFWYVGTKSQFIRINLKSTDS